MVPVPLLLVAGPLAVWPYFRKPEPEPVLVLHTTPEVQLEEETPQFGDEVRSALKEGRYAELDAMAQSFRSRDAMFRSATPKLESFYTGLVEDQYLPDRFENGCRAPIPSSFEATSALFARWQKADPHSITMLTAYAILWGNYAWHARGCGWSNEVSDESWELVNARLAEAEHLLIDVDLTADPAAAYELIQIGALRGFDRGEFDDLYSHAVAAFPWYYPLYGTRARFLLEKWFGEPGEEKAFLDDLRREERGDDGQIAYSVAAYRLTRNMDWRELFHETGLDMHAVIAAYQVRERRYGLNNGDWNALFLLATHGPYCEPAHQALLQIGDQWDPSVWTEKKYFDETVAWFHANSRY